MTDLDHWSAMVDYLEGIPVTLPLDDLPGRRFECVDAPMPADELDAITDPTELALCAGISRKAAEQRISTRAVMAQTTEGQTP